MAQAEAFIEHWTTSYADVWREIIKEVLDQSFRPRDIDAFRTHDMKSIFEHFMYKPGNELDRITEQMESQLSLQYPRQEN